MRAGLNREGAVSVGRLASSWIAVAAWMCFIFFMSSNTSTGLNEGLGLFSGIYRSMQAVQAQVLGEGVDVLSPTAHFCEYAVLGGLLTNALRASGVRGIRRFVLAVACASLYGVTDELHQLFVPGRATDPVDWLVDTCGAALGMTIVRGADRVRRDAGGSSEGSS